MYIHIYTYTYTCIHFALGRRGQLDGVVWWSEFVQSPCAQVEFLKYVLHLFLNPQPLTPVSHERGTPVGGGQCDDASFCFPPSSFSVQVLEKPLSRTGVPRP